MILIINLKNLLKISEDQAAPGKIFLEEVTTSVLSAEKIQTRASRDE